MRTANHVLRGASALLLALAVLSCDDEIDQTGTVAPPVGTVVAERIVSFGGEATDVTLAETSAHPVRLLASAAALPQRTPVTVRVSTVTKSGATVPTSTAVQIATRMVTFTQPVRLQQSVPTPPVGKKYVGVTSQTDADPWQMTTKAPTKVGATAMALVRGAAPARGDLAPAVGEELWEMEIVGSGLWALALVDATGPDGGATADAGAADGGGTRDAAAPVDAGAYDGAVANDGMDAAPLVLFGISSTGCYEVTTVSNVADVCELGLPDSVGWSIAGSYARQTATMSLGRLVGSPPQSSLGSGVVTYNMGTLMRNNTVADGNCTWQEAVTTNVTVTGADAFTVAVSDSQQQFGIGCVNPPPPTSGACTSTWTWTLRRAACPDAGAL